MYLLYDTWQLHTRAHKRGICTWSTCTPWPACGTPDIAAGTLIWGQRAEELRAGPPPQP